MVGALVSQHSIRRNSAHSDRFDVRIIDSRDYPFLQAREGQLYLRDGLKRQWLNDDLQSFTPLRFVPPELMGYEGRAIVIDPDVFAVGDVCELLTRDMQGKAILCRTRGGTKRTVRGSFASRSCCSTAPSSPTGGSRSSSAQLFTFERDYTPWIGLQRRARETIGVLETEWNDFDRLTRATKMLHNTRRKTQPWKTGLPVDFTPGRDISRCFPPLGWLMPARRRLFGDYALLGALPAAIPTRDQERFFFGLLRECVEQGIVARTCCARRWPPTTSATTRSSAWPRRRPSTTCWRVSRSRGRPERSADPETGASAAPGTAPVDVSAGRSRAAPGSGR